MCHIFAGQPPANYAFHTRSIRLAGHSTSIRLEAAFWNILEEIAVIQDVSLAKFLTKLHDEVLELHGEAHNFASLLRCACLSYVMEIRSDMKATLSMRREAQKAFGVAMQAAE